MPASGTLCALALWAALIVALRLALWIGGVRDHALARAVEQGAARAEQAGVGEIGDEALRKAVRIQQRTYPFWAVLQALDDLVLEPIAPAIRALTVATLFAGLAALGGRPTRFAEGLAAAARGQGWWVLGLGLSVVLMLGLRRTEVETSAALLLPAGVHDAVLWTALRQLDVFALIGWGLLARGAWALGQANLALAVVVCAMLWLGESVVRVAFTLVTGAGMRLTLLG